MTSINFNPSSSNSGSGLDVTAVVDQILYAERAPQRLWQQQQARFSAQATALSNLNSNLTGLKDKVNALKDLSGAITAKAAASSDTSVVTASVEPNAPSGVHLVTVTSLATTSSYYTDPLTSSTDPLATGSFSLKVGSANAVLITVDGSNNTLDKLAAYINGQNLGVNASVIRDANGARLALVSQSTGSTGDLSITGDTTGLGFHKSSAGVNASLSVDGVPVSSASNTVIGVLEGVTLNLTGAAPTRSVSLTVRPDSGRASAAVKDFVAAYNAAVGAINAQFTYNPATTSAAPLAANSSLRALQASLLADVTYSISGNNGLVNLASLGVNMNNDGTLTVDSPELDGVLANHFADFQNFFQSAAPSGFARHFGADLIMLTDSTQGILNLNLKENSSNQRALGDQIAELEDRLVLRKQQLVDQYSRIDIMLRQLPLLQSQISGQLAGLMK